MGMDRKLLQRWMNGELNPAEESALIRQLEERTDEEMEAFFPENEWEQITPMLVDAARQRRTLQAIHAVTHTIYRPWWKRKTFKAACVVGLLVLGGYFATKSRLTQIVAQTSGNDWRAIATADGIKKLITLSDGTRISLNGGSQVDIPDDFTDGQREIRLVEGEIFLDVAQDEERPFIVTTEKIKVRVLGTSFNVRKYHEEQKTVVAVKTGKVSLQSQQGGQEVLLTPGAQVVFDNKAAAFSQKIWKETGMIGGWKNNELWYEDDLLKDVLRDLAYNYGVRFQVRDSTVLNKHVNAIFIKRSKEDIIRILGKMADFEYEMNNAEIIIY